MRTNMLKPRSEHLSLIVEDKIFILGGGSKHSNAVEVEIFDPATNRWSFGADFVEERKIFAGCVYEGQIYITGGNFFNHFMIYTFTCTSKGKKVTVLYKKQK